MAGVILLGTGVVYALVGIKTKWLHTFFSTAFLTSLGTTVLILYVMTPPVSNAIQGAYVAAVVCTGLILGVLAVVFKEVTECLGCLLGGFCLSMWLLALQPGGLVPHTGGKVALIAVFTVGGTCLYFTKWTRAYGLICSISFTGATVAVLGIDCFSRAGLREFWAYIWALNDHLFPLGAVTYPLTRGIRVELAVTILIFLAGIVSQLKLWRIVKEQRDRKDAELAEGERSLRVEEENVGRQVEEANGRERREWERVHGNGNARDSASQLGLSDDSGIGDMGSEKPGSNGAEDATTTQAGAEAKMVKASSDLPAGRAATPFSLTGGATTDGPAVGNGTPEEGRVVTVRVADDDAPYGPRFPVSVPEGDGNDAGSKDQTSPSVSSQTSPPMPPALTVVPLPFRVPGPASNGDSSSVATFADEDDEYGKTPLMSPSIREDSPVLVDSENSDRGFASRQRPEGEELVEVQKAASTVETDPSLRDENDSVVANLDDLDSVEEESVGDGEASLGVAEGPAVLEPSGVPSMDGDANVRQGDGDSSTYTDEPIAAKPVVSGDDVSVPASTTPPDEGLSEKSPAPEEAADRDESTTAAAPAPASLTKGNLPPPLSRIAKSYRTNEWAKHLGIAEAPVPEPEPLARPNQSDPLKSPAPSEEAVPVNVWELQQTPNNAVPPPAAPRSISPKSTHALHQEASRDSLGLPMAAITTPSPDSEHTWNRPGHRNSTSKPARNDTQPIAEERNRSPPQPFRRLAAPINPIPPPPRARSSTPFLPTRDLTPTPPPNLYTPPPQHTLIGMRETLLRNKASYGQFLPQPGDLIPMIMPEGSRDHRTSWPVTSDDEDDMPLSQRRAMMMRRSSNNKLAPPTRTWSPAPATAETSTFNSHQPQRHSTAPSQAVRQAQLANFRNSVAMDLRAVNRSATPPVQGPGLVAMAVNSGRQGVGMVYGAGDEVGMRTRSSLMILRAENEAGQEREREREREFAVEERMRSGVMMEAHRDALRKMQRGVGGL